MQSNKRCLWFTTSIVKFLQFHQIYGGIMIKIHYFHFSYIMNNETFVYLISYTANICILLHKFSVN